jgi:preprotein translocase subunit SecA
MDSLRYSIGLRGYGQRDPLIEYKAEAFRLFEDLMVNIKTEICHNIFRSASSLMAFENFLRNVPQRTTHQSTSAFGGSTTGADAVNSSPGSGNGPSKASDIVSEAAAAAEKARPVRSGPKVGRNDPCPCKSGKKYKHCCGKM